LPQVSGCGEAVLGKAHADTMTRYMKEYSDQMVRLGQGAKADIDEAVLRKAGSQMVSFAEEFVVKEKDASSRLFTAMKQIPLIFIVVLLILMIGIFITVTRQLVLSLNRFMEHTKRIGEGNFSPIVYNTRDSDEFAQLAEAINQMVKELDHRHEILVQSHKLRAIGTLVAGVAHELNNPLNNTMLTAAMLKEDLKTLTTDEKMEMIDDIIHETERSQRIVRELLNFARENKTDIKALKIEEIMSDSIRLVANQVRLAKVSISLDFVKDLPPIHGDEQMLKQVFVNLILNAVDVLPPQGAIVISIHKQGKPGFITVDISDNGPGRSEERRVGKECRRLCRSRWSPYH
jgi:signal transduction histidine kinase